MFFVFWHSSVCEQDAKTRIKPLGRETNGSVDTSNAVRDCAYCPVIHGRTSAYSVCRRENRKHVTLEGRAKSISCDSMPYGNPIVCLTLFCDNSIDTPLSHPATEDVPEPCNNNSCFIVIGEQYKIIVHRIDHVDSVLFSLFRTSRPLPKTNVNITTRARA